MKAEQRGTRAEKSPARREGVDYSLNYTFLIRWRGVMPPKFITQRPSTAKYFRGVKPIAKKAGRKNERYANFKRYTYSTYYGISDQQELVKS